MNEYDKALLYGYELANGRGWFSLAQPNATHVDTVYTSLLLSGYLAPYPPGSADMPTRVSNRWQRDYQFTPKGLWRIQELTKAINWEEKAKDAYGAYCTEYDNEKFLPHMERMHIYKWEELQPVHQRAWVAAVKAIADGFNMRWTDTDIPVTSSESK